MKFTPTHRSISENTLTPAAPKGSARRASVRQLLASGTALSVLAVLVGQMNAVAVPGDDDGGVAGLIGPDVIVGGLPSIQKWGTVGGITAYSIGTTSCNIGDQQLDWVQGTNQHPVIPQNLYRLKDGRFEQIGMSWLKHGFCALQETLCGSCTPAGFGCESKLGVGCSDPYSSSLNGTQSNLGPRSQVNPATGFFTYPFTAPPAAATVGRRLQVANSDITTGDGSLYYCESMYIHPDDAAAGNDDNNASYRKVNVGSFSGGGYNLSPTGSTVQQLPAIYAWQVNDPAVTITPVDVVGDGRFHVGYRVTDNGDGTWHYEYAILNLNSNRAMDGFSLPIPNGVTVTNVGFKDINHHSGEPYDTTDWTISVAGGAITWSAVAAAPVENTNALRWGTMFNFRFDADSPPQAVSATLDLFKAGGPTTATVAALGPQASCEVADLNCDGAIDGADLGALLAAWGTDGADLNGDGTTDGADLGVLLAAWD